MSTIKSHSFSAKIEIIGINPFVFIPEKILHKIFIQAGKEKGKIPVSMKMDGHEFTQTLVKYAGHWRLYLNKPMRIAAGKETGATAKFNLAFNPIKKEWTLHPKLEKALLKNKAAKNKFDSLAPSLQSEISRYISRIKTEDTRDKNVLRAINYLLGKERFIGREHP